jgi:DNA-binding phage protein
MALTRDFKEFTMERARKDPKFRLHLLKDGIEMMLSAGEEDVAVGKSLLRDYINATIGFQGLAKQLDKKPESLMRMFSTRGNPRLDSLAAVLRQLQVHEGVTLTVKATKASGPPSQQSSQTLRQR